jgi:putative tricarboxylic transport membrane protein
MDMGNAGKKAAVQSWKEKVNFNTVAALFLLIFSVVAYLLIPYQIEKPQMIFGRSLMNLEPSFFPRLSIVGLFFLSLWYLTHSFQIPEKNLFKEMGKAGLTRVGVTFLVTLGYALLFEPLGFVLSSGLMVLILTIYFGNRNLFLIVAVTAAAPLIVYYLFTKTLQVSLPEIPFF